MRKALRLTSLGFVMGLLVGAGSFATAQSVGKVSAASKAVTATATVNEAVAVKIVGERDGHVVGTLVARIGDKWVEVELATAAETARMDLKSAP